MEENVNFISHGESASDGITQPDELIHKLVQPLQLIWEPKEDITTYELAMCIPLLSIHSPIMPNFIDKTAGFMRHFKVIDPNV